MIYLAQIVLLLLAGAAQETELDRSKIEIINSGEYIPYRIMQVEAGPVTGNILNAHYFPGLEFYNGGRYREADEQFTYVILRPYFMEQNPRRPEFMSTSYYLRGMIYAYHAKGVGRQSAAKADFEAALKWNPRNYIVLLELSRLYSGLGFREQAVTLIKHLLELKPDAATAKEAQAELDKLSHPDAK